MLTEEEYLEVELKAETKSEFVNGEMFAMSGASFRHVLVVKNVTTQLDNALPSCYVLPTDLRVRVSPRKAYTYPDLSVVCGEPLFADDQHDTLLNPTLIIEVLSPSTESHDRGQKFWLYRSLESLREYLIVAQDRPEVDQYIRQSDHRWELVETHGIDQVVKLASVPCEIPMERIYQRVTFGE